MAEPAFVTVYSKSTGQKQRIPRRWLGTRIGADFEVAPKVAAAEANRQDDDDNPPPGNQPGQSDQAPQPLPVDEQSTDEELIQYAAEHGIELGDAQNEAQALAVIQAHHESLPSGENQE